MRCSITLAPLILRNVVLLRFGYAARPSSDLRPRPSTPPVVCWCALKNSSVLSVKQEHSFSCLSQCGPSDHQSPSLYLCNTAGENLARKLWSLMYRGHIAETIPLVPCRGPIAPLSYVSFIPRCQPSKTGYRPPMLVPERNLPNIQARSALGLR